MAWHQLKANRKQQPCLWLTLAAGAAGILIGQAAEPDKNLLFEQQIRPMLAENCAKCHSHAAEKIKGGLVLDSFEAILKGGRYWSRCGTRRSRQEPPDQGRSLYQ